MVSPAPEPTRRRIAAAAQELRERLGCQPAIAMLLAGGPSTLAAELTDPVALGATDLPSGMRLGEDSSLVVGSLGGTPVILGDAPMPTFEGHHPADVTFPVRVLQGLGVETLILTVGAASLQHEPGSVIVVEDHLNFSEIHPLRGRDASELGPRFPDMSQPYDPGLRDAARAACETTGQAYVEGVFAAVPGPGLPTRAEYRFLHRAGAELVGTSLVPEVITAVHCGLRVLALAGVTQLVDLDAPQPVSIDSMLDHADLAAQRTEDLIRELIRSPI